MKALHLPALQVLLARLHAAPLDAGDECSLTPPHERALARELGFEGADGALPWAAHLAARDGIDTGDLAWGLLSPSHWHVGADSCRWPTPMRWISTWRIASAARRGRTAVRSRRLRARVGRADALVRGARVAGATPTASLDRVIGRNVDRWLPGSRIGTACCAACKTRCRCCCTRIPMNAEREARGQLPVNSFWLSGCGVRQPTRSANDLVVLDALRRPALHEDWAAWREAWQALDAGPIAEALQSRKPVTLTLGGERSAQRFESQAGGWWSQLSSRWRAVDVAAILEAL